MNSKCKPPLLPFHTSTVFHLLPCQESKTPSTLFSPLSPSSRLHSDSLPSSINLHRLSTPSLHHSHSSIYLHSIVSSVRRLRNPEKDLRSAWVICDIHPSTHQRQTLLTDRWTFTPSTWRKHQEAYPYPYSYPSAGGKVTPRRNHSCCDLVTQVAGRHLQLIEVLNRRAYLVLPYH